MSNDFPLLLDQIRGLLDAAPDDEAGLAEMENTLTDGCARALLLETERVRIEKQIGELAQGDELTDLSGDEQVVIAAADERGNLHLA